MLITRGPLLAAGAVLATTALGLALYLFQPWTLLVDEQVSDALPVVASSTSSEQSEASEAPSPPASPEPSSPVYADGGTGRAFGGEHTASPAPSVETAAAVPAGPVELARGDLISHEHTTEGTARVLLLADGSRVLRLEGLDTSNGPDLKVWLTDAPVLEGRAGWFVFDDGAFVDLGELRGNQGDANYGIPPDVDLEVLTSISIWCERFAVSFGAAELA